ncbi:SMP-30/gluconolactonase/LRE family protein [Georgenia sp. SYP-B2076]|uniref:ABC transporter permease n=1 Tax=Georgenia sp. SYP-B2076 TaxID=2495881 RepID=UPI000F8E51C0|nr:SMP-30/gluconolactonase/LRE family protein [Georgenia sp. SYP-B2076]
MSVQGKPMARQKAVDGYWTTGQPRIRRLAPGRTVSDVLAKPWMEGGLPVVLAVALAAAFAMTTPAILSSSDRHVILSQFVEVGLLAVAMTIVLLGGGFDLSVGAIMGNAAIGSLVLLRVYELPATLTIVVVLIGGALLGSLNGFFIAVAKTRPLITTLVMMVALFAMLQLVQSHYSARLVAPVESLSWEFVGHGAIAGVSVGLWVMVAVVAVTHVVLTRSRWGWWLAAVGTDRRSARRNGISIGRVTFLTYVISGVLSASAGVFISARQGSTSASVGVGYEIVALTAVVLGGVSLGGGRGSAIRAAVGALVVAILSQSIFRQGLDQEWYSFALALTLIVFAILDEKFYKYRGNLVQKLAMSPFRYESGPLLDYTSQSVWKLNEDLTSAEPIGLGVVEGPEDCVVDDAGRLYCGDRRGWIWRFSGENFEDSEIFVRTGGLPLGHVFDPSGNLVVAVGGIGVGRIAPDRSIEWVATKTRRTRFRVFDDSAIRFADDLDIAADGSIYVSDASTRLQASNHHLLAAEFRPDGRLLRIDPDGSVETVVRNMMGPNGIATAHDGMSILIASTFSCRVDRLWIAGPKQGQLEPFMENLPGNPDNINRASDGGYWLSFTGMRTGFSDLILKHPEFRRRMIRQLPVDDLVFGQTNVSCVAKFTEAGEIVRVLWDSTQERHSMVTSMSERNGYLYLGGLHNNRVGRLALDPADVGPIDPYKVPGTVAGDTSAVGEVVAR